MTLRGNEGTFREKERRGEEKGRGEKGEEKSGLQGSHAVVQRISSRITLNLLFIVGLLILHATHQAGTQRQGSFLEERRREKKRESRVLFDDCYSLLFL